MNSVATSAGHLLLLTPMRVTDCVYDSGGGAMRVTDCVYDENGPVGSGGECITTFDQEK